MSAPKSSGRRRWMDWTPTSCILVDSAKGEPAKPTEPGFVGFEGGACPESPKIAAQPGLVPQVNATDAGVNARQDVFRRQFEATVPPAVPAFLFRPGVPYVKGRC